MRALICAMALATIACGGGGSGGGSQPSTVSRPIRGPADLITDVEIEAGVYQNALEVVQNLRPTMLRPRGSTNQGPVYVVLYVDGVRLGELKQFAPETMTGLVMLPANRVKEIRYINASDATTRWGTGHGSGVILVTTKR